VPDNKDDWSDFIKEQKRVKAAEKNGGTNGTTFNSIATFGQPIATSTRDRNYALGALRKECEALAAMAPNSGRNNTLNNAVFSLTGFVTSGALSEAEVVDNLGAAALAAGLPLGEAQATVRSALQGSKAKGVVRAAPPREDPNDWFSVVAASALIQTDDPAIPGLGLEVSGPDAQSANGNARAGVDPDDTGSPTLESIEEDFWTARPELELIYTAALAQMASPWAVLACCVTRILCLIPPAITLPPIIGARGSLNWFTALTAKSGGGKGAAMSVARELVYDDILVKPIGSGEGMAECYNRKPKKKKDDDDADNFPVTSILFDVSEVDSLGAMSNRTGQTTLAILRQGFSGETLGYSYRGRHSEQVPAHTYRMTLVVAVQPERAGILLDDGGGGIPQRFMWFPARDKRITADVPEWPVDNLDRPRRLLTMSSSDIARAAGNVNVPREVWAEIREARAMSMRDDDNALDGHALFCREKLAYALAYMDARTAIDLEDWRLAGIAARVSDWMRDKAIKAYEGAQEDESRKRGRLRGVEHAALEVGKVREQLDQPARVVRWALNKIMKAGLEGISNRDLARASSSRDRDLLPGALDYLVTQGKISQIEGTTTWVVC
jgi:hypothetical protein